MPMSFRIIAASIALASGAGTADAMSPITLGDAGLRELPPLIEEAFVARRGFVARGPRGGVVAGGGMVARPGFRPVRPVPVPVRPVGHWWHPGMAVAAGAAIGFVTAATAAAWAGAPPAPGYCWYYTDPGRRQGFWDLCP